MVVTVCPSSLALIWKCVSPYQSWSGWKTSRSNWLISMRLPSDWSSSSSNKILPFSGRVRILTLAKSSVSASSNWKSKSSKVYGSSSPVVISRSEITGGSLTALTVKVKVVSKVSFSNSCSVSPSGVNRYSVATTSTSSSPSRFDMAVIVIAPVSGLIERSAKSTVSGERW